MLCIFGVFNSQIDYSTKLCFIDWIVVALWNRLKKDAVCLASRDPNQLLVQDSQSVNASNTPEINIKTRFDWQSLFRNFRGTQIWDSHLDKETLEAEQFAHPKVQTKCAAQERLCGRGHLLLPPPLISQHQDRQLCWWKDWLPGVVALDEE